MGKKAWSPSRNHRIALSPTEFRILRILVKNRGCVVTKSTIIEAVWGGPSQTVGEDHLRVHLASLRKKMREADSAAESLIKTAHGVGYRIEKQ